MILPDEGEWHERYPVWGAMQALRERLEPAPAVDPQPGLNDWGPLPLAEFMRGQATCEAHAPGRRWLELGSGVGSNLFLAHMLGWEPEGIELRHEYVEASRALFPECPVTQGDASNFGRYPEFDVVYCYGLFPTPEAMADLLACIELAPGALLFATGGPEPEGLQRISPVVWRA